MSVCRVVKCDKKRKHRSAGPLLHGGPSGAADDPSVSKLVLQSRRRPNFTSTYCREGPFLCVIVQLRRLIVYSSSS